MKKSILNLEGAQELTKNEQKSINGGAGRTPELCLTQDGTPLFICYPPLRCKGTIDAPYCG